MTKEHKKNNSTYNIAMCGVLTALAMIFSYIESIIPVPIPVPGIKLGVANIAVITILYTLGIKEAVIINILRISLTAMLFGNLNSFLFSIAGAVLSMVTMIVLKKIDSFLEKQDIKQDAKIKSIELASSLGTDLVEVLSCPTPYCEECAKYLNRIYSISGEDNRFPKLPEGFTSREPGHHFSCLRVYPFSYGITPLSFDCEDVISYSNRPFIDERTEEQIEEYNTYLRSKEEEAKLQRKNEDFMLENAKRKRTDLNNLQWLKENIPDIAPKSLSGFRRMRTTNSKNYQKIVEEAAKLGKNI